MAGPNYGALGATFKVTRVLQAMSLIAIIGMTANFVSGIVSADTAPKSILIGTLSVVGRAHVLPLHKGLANHYDQVCVAVLYCAITVILFMDNILPFLINSILDSLFLIAVVVVAVILGRQVSFTNCKGIGPINGPSSSAYTFIAALDSGLDNGNWTAASQTTCYEVKSIWGLSIALW